jgi:hypothetical protein
MDVWTDPRYVIPDVQLELPDMPPHVPVYCKRCQRQLRSKQSRAVGYGRHCAKLEGLLKPRNRRKV